MSASNPRDLLGELNRLESLKYQGELDTRRYPRFAVRGTAELQVINPEQVDQAPLEINLRDIGWAGVGFVTEKPLAVGSYWRIGFLHHGYVVGQQALLIRHCKSVDAGLYLVGAQFCVEPGLLSVLGVDPRTAEQDDAPLSASGDADFLTPDDM